MGLGLGLVSMARFEGRGVRAGIRVGVSMAKVEG